MIFAIFFFLAGNIWWRKAGHYKTPMRLVSRTIAGFLMILGIGGTITGTINLSRFGVYALVNAIPSTSSPQQTVNVPQPNPPTPTLDYPATIAVLQAASPSPIPTPQVQARSNINVSNPIPTATDTIVAKQNERSWETAFQDMQDREVYICADTADLRSGPDISYPIVFQMRRSEHSIAYGWVRDWFYLGEDTNHRDYFVHNSDTCPLSQPTYETNAAPTRNPNDPFDSSLWEQDATRRAQTRTP